MIDENGDLEFFDDRSRGVVFSRRASSEGKIFIFVEDGGSQAYGQITIEELELALRYARGEEVEK